jgi:hypothetical protein
MCKQRTLSTTIGVGRLSHAPTDQGASQKSLQYCARKVCSRSRHPLSAMRSRTTTQIVTCYILLVLCGDQKQQLLTWHDIYAIERGVTLCTPMICATCVLTFLVR